MLNEFNDAGGLVNWTREREGKLNFLYLMLIAERDERVGGTIVERALRCPGLPGRKPF